MVPRQRADQDRPLYMISVAAELTGVHPQTLRIYERKQLVCPQRSAGNTRLYSQSDIERLQLIQQLTQDEGVNLAGVTRIIDLQREVEQMQLELVAAHQRLLAAEKAARDAIREHQARTALVRVRSGAVMRHGG